MMKRQIRRAAQAYRELPWRKQLRWLTGALAVAVAIAAVIGLEVHLSAEAVALSYQTRSLQEATVTAQQEIVEMQTALAQVYSVAALQQWAEAHGYRQVTPDQMHFVPVPPEAIAPADVQIVNAQPLTPVATEPLPEEYTISLLRLLSRYLFLEPAQ